MITKDMIRRAYEYGIIQLVLSPHNGDGIVCQIGEYWFYFGGVTAAESNSVEDYKRAISTETIIEEIYAALSDFPHEEYLLDEYSYYESVLCKSGISNSIFTRLETIFAAAKSFESRASECLPGNSHNYEFYLGKARGIIEGAALTLGMSYDELNAKYTEWWKENR